MATVPSNPVPLTAEAILRLESPTLELVPGLRPSPFDARPGAAREVAFAVTPLHPLRAAARTLAGATLNDAVLAVVAGELRRWLHRHHGPVVHQLRIKVPVSLHTVGDVNARGPTHDVTVSGPPCRRCARWPRLRRTTCCA